VLGEPCACGSLGWLDVQAAGAGAADHPADIRVEADDDHVLDQRVLDEDVVGRVGEARVSSADGDVAAALEQFRYRLDHVLVDEER
jgi:hypothetical protein